MDKKISGTVEHLEVAGAKGVVEASFMRAVEAGRWMVAVWAVEGDRIVLLDRTTWKFPPGDFAAAVAQLDSVCRAELKAIGPSRLPDDPLPLATLGEVRRAVADREAPDGSGGIEEESSNA
jgi:hypothetical protein